MKRRRRQIEIVDCALEKRDLEGEGKLNMGLMSVFEVEVEDLSWGNNTRSIPMPLLLLLSLSDFAFVIAGCCIASSSSWWWWSSQTVGSFASHRF